MSPRVVLAGPPGAGKSTVSVALAERLGLVALDTDDLVEQRAGTTIGELFVERGEAYFRSVEKEAVADALAHHDGVLALGGGAILDTDTQALLGYHRVVFLDVSLRYAARRSGFDQGRPLLALNPRGRWLQLMAERRPVYERLAWLRVDTDGLGVAEVTDRIVAELDGCEGTGGTDA